MDDLFGSDASDDEAADRPKKARKRRSEDDAAPRKRPKKEAADGEHAGVPTTCAWQLSDCAGGQQELRGTVLLSITPVRCSLSCLSISIASF